MPSDPDNGGSLATFKKIYAKLAPKRKSAAGGMDFLPEGYAERRAKRRADVILLSLFGIVVASIGVTWHWSEQSLAEAEAGFAAVDAEYANAARRIEQVRQMQDRQKSVADRMELSASLLERMPRSNLMAEVTNSLPHGVVLAEASLDAKKRATPPRVMPAPGSPAAVKGAPAEPPAPLAYDTELGLEGTALTEGQVSDYIDSLSRGGYFSSVDLKWVRLEKKGQPGRDAEEVRRFLILLKLDPTAEARPQSLAGGNDLTSTMEGDL